MPSAFQGSLPFQYADFHGGLNTLASPELLTDDQARALLNVQGTTAGAIVKRNGFQTVAAVTNPPGSLFSPTNANLLCSDPTAGTLYRSNLSGGLLTVKTGLTTGTLWEWLRGPVVAGQGPTYGMDGVNTPQQWNESTGTGNWTNASGGVAVPNGRYCIYHQNQAFVAGTTVAPAGLSPTDPTSTVYWSALKDPTNWDPVSLTGAGFMEFDPNDGQSITGLGKVGPYLLVFKPTKTWALVNPAAATARQISDRIGCPAHRSIASGAEGTYFLSMDRVYITNGTRLDPISDLIQPTLDSTQVRLIAAAAYFNSHYYLSVTLNQPNVNDTVLDYDAKLKSWWQHSLGVSQWASVNMGGTNFVNLYAANAQTAFLSQAFVSGVHQDNGSNFTWSWSGPWQSPVFYRRRRFPFPEMRKRLRQVRYLGLGQLDVSLATNFDTSTNRLLAADVFANSSVITQARSAGQGVASAWSFTFSGTYPTRAMLTSYLLAIIDRRDSLPT